MATGGPYTEKASGQLPEEYPVLDPAATTPDPAQPKDEYGYSAVKSYDNPYADDGGVATPSRPLEIDPTGYAWQPDFYPGAREPHVLGQTRGVGKYQGAPIFNRTSGPYPMDVIASRNQYLANERKQLDAMARKIGDPLSQLEDIHRAEYEKNANRWAFDQLQQEQEDVIALYGGDERAAMAAIADPGSVIGRQHQRLLADVNATRRLLNQNTKEAEAVIKGMEDGTRTWVQDVHDEAVDYLNGVSTGGDARKAAQLSTDFRSTVEIHKFIKDSGLQQLLQRSGNEVDTLGKPRYAGGMWITDKNTTVKTPDEVFDAVVESFPPKFLKDAGGEEKVRKILKSYTNEKFLQDPIARSPPSSSGDGKRSGWVNGGYEQNGVRVDVQYQGKEDALIDTYDELGNPRPKEDLYALKIRRDSDGEYVDLRPIELRNGNDVNVLMVPNEIIRRNGRWFVSGKQYAYGKQQAPSAKGGFTPYPSTDSAPQEQEFKELKNIWVPLDNNMDWARIYGVDRPDELIRQWQGRGGQGAAKETTQGKTTSVNLDKGGQSISGGRPPVAGAKQAPDGKWYIKKEDGYYEVQ